METVFKVGDVVMSMSGHDKNRLFIVLSIDKNGYICIIDGRYRGLKNPKMKNPKHLLKITQDLSIIDKINTGIATDKEIYNLIKVHRTIKE